MEALGVVVSLVLEVLVLEVLELPGLVLLLELEVSALGVLLLEVLGLEALELVLSTLALESLELEVPVLGVLLLEALELVLSTLELGTLGLEVLVLGVLLLVALELEVLELLEELELEMLLLESLELEVLLLEALELEVLELLEALELEVLLLEALELEVLELLEALELEALELEVLLLELLELEVLLLEALGLEVLELLEALELLDLESDLVRAAHPTVTCLLATVVTDPSFESAAASALVSELVDFAAACRLHFAASLVAQSESVCPLSIGGECALGTDVLEERQEDFECLGAAAPHLVAMLLAHGGDPDAPDILTPRSYAEAIAGEYSSQWQTAMDAEMASWKSTGTYVDAVPPSGANVVLLHVAAQRDYELHSLDFSIAFLQGSLHEEIWLRRPPGFTGSIPPGTQWSLRRPVYGLRQAPREWHNTLRTTLAALGFAPWSTDASLFLRTDTSLPPFYILVYIDDLVFATADTEALALVKSEL
ncbi:unnamed protein product [Closterium sp. Naga37s-1]|nr:unnamed protein product [Closterium sp. Naga37s-1]CAI5529786.1 unnamed protein product [Closterium sp. Naga37s-1]